MKLSKCNGVGSRGGTVYLFWCPGCKEPHPFEVPAWTWNGSMEAPTFSPSLMCSAHVEEGKRRCHLFMANGQIQFLNDCFHDLAGQTVECPEWDSYRQEPTDASR